MDKEGAMKDFSRRRASPAGFLNNGFVHQDSDSSMAEANLGQRRSSQSLAIPQITVKKGNALTRRMSSFASGHVAQVFTEQAKRAVSKFSSVNYSPTHSITYMDQLRTLKRDVGTFDIDRWILTLVIGVATGLVATFLNQCLGGLGQVKWRDTQKYMEEDRLLASWGWTAGISVVFVLISSVLVAFVHPPAAGGGTPEVLAYLNGVVVHGVFGLKSLVIKFTANVFAVSSGLPCAIQGPLIAYGAVIGKGFGQFRSETLSCTPKCFTRFRNAIDRRAFTTAGVAAGVAAGFNAPLGGLLFAMEDLSSFWSKRLSWQVFFASVVATGVAGMFNTAFSGFKFGGTFGLFTLSVTEPIQIHVALLCVSIVLGVLGGVMGAIFTLLNTRVVGVARKLALSKMSKPWGFKVGRVAEPVILALIMSVYYTVLPTVFECTNIADVTVNLTNKVEACLNEGGITVGNFTSPIKLTPFACKDPVVPEEEYYYNEMATIVQNGGSAQLDALWSRGTHYYFRWYILLTMLAVWFPMATWTLGSCIAGGIFVPTLLSGALYGRSLGLGMLALYRHISGNVLPLDGTWAWLDPGLIAVIGSGGMLGGVTRLVLATTVIVVEMSNDINLVIPILIAVFVAKHTADVISKPLYKCQLDAKTLPYLDQEPEVAVKGQFVNLELFKASDVMSSPVRAIRAVESLYSLSQLLTSTEHEGFPVIKRDFDSGLDVCYGLITRNELYTILYSDDLYNEKTPQSVIDPDVEYDQLSEDYATDTTAQYERVKAYGHFDVYKQVFVNLDPFINISVSKVDGDYSLQRTYQLFRTLGLRHLVVVDIRNQPIGMITRQDLMAFNIQDKLTTLPTENAINALMNESMSSEDCESSDTKSDSIVLPGVTVPSISSKIVETIHEESEEESDAASTPKSSRKRSNSKRSVTSDASTVGIASTASTENTVVMNIGVVNPSFDMTEL